MNRRFFLRFLALTPLVGPAAIITARAAPAARPVSLNVVRKLTIRASTEGVAQTTAALRRLQAAYDRANLSTSTIARAQERYVRRFGETVRT